MLRIVALSGSLLVLVSLAGCGDDAMPPPPPAADGGGRLDARVDARAGDGDIPPMPDGGMDAPPGEDAGSDGGDPCLGVDCSEMDDPCHLGVCNPATRDCEQQVRADGSSCDDGVPCTAGDVCASGACAGVAAPTAHTMTPIHDQDRIRIIPMPFSRPIVGRSIPAGNHPDGALHR